MALSVSERFMELYTQYIHKYSKPLSIRSLHYKSRFSSISVHYKKPSFQYCSLRNSLTDQFNLMQCLSFEKQCHGILENYNCRFKCMSTPQPFIKYHGTNQKFMAFLQLYTDLEQPFVQQLVDHNGWLGDTKVTNYDTKLWPAPWGFRSVKHRLGTFIMVPSMGIVIVPFRT